MPGKIIGKEDHTTRVGKEFIKEIEEVRKERLELKIDTKKKSTRRLTNLLVKHKLWPKIKAEMIQVDLERKR